MKKLILFFISPLIFLSFSTFTISADYCGTPSCTCVNDPNAIDTCNCVTSNVTNGFACIMVGNGCGQFTAQCNVIPSNPTNTPVPQPTSPPSPTPPPIPGPTSPPASTICCGGPVSYCANIFDAVSCNNASPQGCHWGCALPTPITSGTQCTNRDGECVPVDYVCTTTTVYVSDCASGYKCVPATASCGPSGACCRSPSNGTSNPLCSNIDSMYGTGWFAYVNCAQTGCQWNCPIPPSATPIPERGIPKVFCNPGGNNSGGSNPAAGGISTNLGCIPYESHSFANSAITWGVGLGGGIALIVLGYAAFLFVSSGGDPKKVQAARELIIALLGGLALIIFAVMLLNYLGVNILGLQNIGFQQ